MHFNMFTIRALKAEQLPRPLCRACFVSVYLESESVAVEVEFADVHAL